MRTGKSRTAGALTSLTLVLMLSLTQSGCVSTAIGVAGATVKGTAKVGTTAVKTTTKAGGAVVGAAIPDKEDGEDGE